MICYIKSFKDFRTIAKYDAVSYSLPDGEDGHITIYEKDPVQLMTKYVGCWLVIGDGKTRHKSNPYSFTTEVDENGGVILNISGSGLNVYENPLATGGLEFNINAQTIENHQYVYYISGCSPEDDSLDLTIQHPIYAFGRAVLYDGSTTYGTLIKNILDNDFGINCPDSEYTMTYMTVTATDATECTIEPDQFGYIVPSEVFEMARKDGVIIDFKNTPTNTLEVDVRTANYDSGYVVFGDGHSIIQSESYDASYCAKATVLEELPDEYKILDQSELFDARNDIKYLVQIGQEITKTKTSGKMCLGARIYLEWPESSLSEPDPYTANRLDIWEGADSSGTQLLQCTPAWERSPEAGTHYTEWFELTSVDDASTLQIFCICRADGARGTDHSIEFTLDYIVPSSDVKEGPKQEQYSEDHGTYYRVLDYYLTIDKQIVREPPEVRPQGAWNVYQANTSESPLMVATGAFSGNSDNHKIEFYSDKRFEYYQPMILRLRGEILETIITSRTLSRNDGRYFYKCGNLMTTLTDHVRGLEKSSKI